MSNNNIDFRFLAEEVMKRLDILEAAEQEGLSLKRKGKNYFALCPFHSERTPSFAISQKKQIFKCFSCGMGGNVITLLATLRGVSNGRIIYQYARAFGLIDNQKMSREQHREIRQRSVKFEFKKQEEAKFNEVYTFLCDQIHAFRKAMKQVKNEKERDLVQEHYQIYDRLPYYQYLLECMYGGHGEIPQVKAYLEGEEVMKKWNLRINSLP